MGSVLSIAFFGFFRIGELTTPSDSSFDPQVHMTTGDVVVVNPNNTSALRIHLKRIGVDVFVGRTGDYLCPVAAVLAYL